MSSPPIPALDVIDAALTGLLATDPRLRSVAVQKHVLVRIRRILDRLPALQYREIAALKRQASPAELGDTVARAVADLLRISRPDATTLVDAADNLGPRTALSGEPLEPWLAATAPPRTTTAKTSAANGFRRAEGRATVT